MLEAIGLVLTVAGAIVNYVNRGNKIDKAIDKAIGKRMDRMDRLEDHRKNDVIDVEVIDVEEETN